MTDLSGLYAITPDGLPRVDLLARVEAALAGGCRWLQLRDKTQPPAELLVRAHALRALTRRYGARLIVNDDLDTCIEEMHQIIQGEHRRSFRNQAFIEHMKEELKGE